MLSCRVLCLLAIVLCCVGVTHAAASGHEELVKGAQQKFKETLRLKGECEEATKATRQAGEEAERFVLHNKDKLKTIAADPEEVKKTKIEGQELIENATKAAEKAKEVRDETITSKEKTYENVALYLLQDTEAAEKAVKDAESAIFDANTAIEVAETNAERVKTLLQELDDAVVAAKEKEKQVESQPHPQTNKTSLGEQQGHTEGNQTEQTQKEKQRQHYRSTVTINIHGDNLDALLSGAANNSGMALNDGSSSP
ncbi:uncharacterized protein TM35_000023780, partial [Trypanosoma theileri]